MYSFEILIKSFIRFADLRKLLKSIDLHYPGVVIRIADDSPTRRNHGDFPVKHLNSVLRDRDSFRAIIAKNKNIHFYELPFDSGLSMGRNYLLDRCQSKYFVLMEEDFRVTEKTDLQKLESVLESSGNIVIAGGGTIERGNAWQSGKFRNIGEMKVENGYFVRHKYGANPPTELVSDIECIPCRYLQNFFMGNLDLINQYNIRWEERLKMWLEHGYFFYCIPEKLKIYSVKGVWIDHYWSRPYCYKEYAKRKSMLNILERITGLKRRPKRDRIIYQGK